jgi:hypothetical protein
MLQRITLSFYCFNAFDAKICANRTKKVQSWRWFYSDKERIFLFTDFFALVPVTAKSISYLLNLNFWDSGQ